MLLWSAGNVAEAAVPARVHEWLSERQQRAERSSARKAAREAAATQQDSDANDPGATRAAARRADQRAQRIDAGLDELDLWLRDQLRAGIAGLKAAGPRPLHDLARRLVDAQAPGVATRVRGLTGQLPAEDWPDRVLAELALLRLLVEGWRNRDALPAPLAATVRRRVGIASTAAEIASAGERVEDRWLVLGNHDQAGDKLVERRVWLQGEASSRTALLIAFAPAGQSPGLAYPVGATLEAELAFAPEAVAQRAVVVEPQRLRLHPGGRGAPQSATLDESASAFAAAVAADPWTTSVPAVLGAAVVSVDAKNATWQIVDVKSGACAPLLTSLDEGVNGQEPSAAEEMRQMLLAAGGGRPGPLFGLYRPDGFLPITLFAEAGAVSLT
jgi:hypothetical protein